jgi:uncharacterized protein YjbJ (UPF0337 family)
LVSFEIGSKAFALPPHLTRRGFFGMKTTNPGLGSEIVSAMNKLQFEGGWNEVRGKLKQKYGQLTDDDLMFAEGKDDELLGRLKKKLGKTKEDLRKEIESL